MTLKGFIFFRSFSLLLLKYFIFVKVIYRHSLVNPYFSHSLSLLPFPLPQKVAIFTSLVGLVTFLSLSNTFSLLLLDVFSSRGIAKLPPLHTWEYKDFTLLPPILSRVGFKHFVYKVQGARGYDKA